MIFEGSYTCFTCSNDDHHGYWTQIHEKYFCLTCLCRIAGKYRGLIAPFCDYCEEEFATDIFVDSLLCTPCAGTIPLSDVRQRVAERGLYGRADL